MDRRTALRPPPCMPTRTALYVLRAPLHRNTGSHPPRRRPPRPTTSRQSAGGSGSGTDLPSNPYPVYVAHRWHACCQPATGHRDRWDGSTTVPLPPPPRPRANQVPWCTMQHSEPLPVCPCGLASMLCCPIDSGFKILYFFYYYRHNGIRDVSRVKDGASAYGIVFVKFIP